VKQIWSISWERARRSERGERAAGGGLCPWSGKGGGGVPSTFGVLGSTRCIARSLLAKSNQRDGGYPPNFLYLDWLCTRWEGRMIAIQTHENGPREAFEEMRDASSPFRKGYALLAAAWSQKPGTDWHGNDNIARPPFSAAAVAERERSTKLALFLTGVEKS